MEQAPFPFADGIGAEQDVGARGKALGGRGALRFLRTGRRSENHQKSERKGNDATRSFIHRGAIGKIHGLKVYSKAYRGCCWPRYSAVRTGQNLAQLTRTRHDYSLERITRTIGAEREKVKKRMKRILSSVLALVLATPALLANDKKEEDRLENCGSVIQEIMDIPDDIPQDLIDKADCIIVYPSVLKGAFIFGGSYGRGAMTCRSGEKFNGPWSAPTMMALEGGSFGFQIGGQATDFVLLVMNERGAKAILSSKVKLGADASAAAGPKGRSAEASTDVTMRAEILSYSRARGLFAGVSLSGSTVRPDNRANEKLYNKSVSASDIIFKGVVPVPTGAQKMVAYLNKKSPKNKSSGKEF